MPTPPPFPPGEATTRGCARCGVPLLGQQVAGQEDCPNCRRLAGLGTDGASRQGHAAPSPSTAAGPEVTEAHEPPPPGGRRFQHYEVCLRGDGVNLHELGRGAMGVTYRALDTNLGSPVALKVIGARFSADAQARERFRREARSAAHLRHPNVASVFHFGEENGQCFYAMELIEGETLQERVRREGPQSPGIVLEVGLQVARALMAAEAHGLVHRDLKPGNLMLLAGGPGSDADAPTVKIIDFGLAKAVAAARDGEGDDLTHGGFVGTPAFASPEQFGGGEASPDTRSDIYSLGVTLWYLLVGKSPFAGRTLAEIHDRQTHRALPLDQLEAARVPAPLVRLLRSMLANDPAERPQSARDLAESLRRCREEEVPGVATASPPRRRRRAWPVAAGALALLVVGGIIAAGFFAGRAPWSRQHDVRGAATALSSTEKSVAVLPFENRSADPENAFFADGVQDEILVDLAKIADLKVISRASTMRYRDAAKRDLPEIARALGVTHVVEGSVQRAGNQIRVTAQLIDARTDAHRWAEKYDRPLENIFALQSEIARAIAGQLQAKLSPQERADIEEVPTRDLRAYELYLRARADWNTALDQDDLRVMYERPLRSLREAVALDPTFARAFAFMTELQANVYTFVEKTSAQEAVVRDLAETVARLRPGSGYAHQAMGSYHATVRDDYPRAREEYAEAVRLLPNDSTAVFRLGRVELRMGRWEESLAHHRKAAELDPEDLATNTYYADLLGDLRRYPEALATLDRWSAAHPQFLFTRLDRAWIMRKWKADPHASRAELALLPPNFDPRAQVTEERLHCGYLERDFAAAERDLAACPADAISVWSVPRAYYEGCNARYRGDPTGATTAFRAARAILEAKVRAEPTGERWFLLLATVDAGLGRKGDAIAEARRAVAMCPLERDAYTGEEMAEGLARVLAWTGEREEAITLLQGLALRPCGLHYGDLLEPDWDPLRGDPRFEALVASLAPSTSPQPPGSPAAAARGESK